MRGRAGADQGDGPPQLSARIRNDHVVFAGGMQQVAEVGLGLATAVIRMKNTRRKLQSADESLVVRS